MNMEKKKSRRRYWLILLTLAAAGTSGWMWWTMQRQHAVQPVYREIPVTRSNIEVTILSTGIVEPENRLEIKPPIAGRVEEILVDEGQTVIKGQILAWMSSTERAALLDAARAKGPEELKRWEELYRPTPIMAPISGTIILRNVESGQTFTNADSVFVMSDRLTIKAQVDETDIAQIRLRQKAKIVLDAYPNQLIPARVDQIAYDAKTVNNVTTYTVDVLPEKTPPSMRSGMTANVTFLIASRMHVLTVANEALHVQNGKHKVLVKSPAGTQPLEKMIETGLSDGKHTEIISGLAEGDIALAAEIKSSRKESPSGTNPFSPMAPRRSTGR